MAIAFVYIGFAVADGRPKVIAVESGVALVFVIVAAAAITGSPWLLARPVYSPTGSRIFGSIAISSSPTRAGGRRSASLSTWSRQRSSLSRSWQALQFHH